MKRLGILAVALACAHPQLPGPVADRSLPLSSHSVIAAAGANAGDPAIVQVRDFPHSSIISVVAWSPAETSFGLRANLTRDGKLVRDHRLYVSVFYDGLRTTLATASPSRFVAPRYVVTAGPSPRLLLSTGIARDEYACFYDFDNCSPPWTLGIRVPDELLRANRDSLAVSVFGRDENKAVVILGGDVIGAYLKAVDSVSAALKKSVASPGAAGHEVALVSRTSGLALK